MRTVLSGATVLYQARGGGGSVEQLHQRNMQQLVNIHAVCKQVWTLRLWTIPTVADQATGIHET